MEDQRKQWQHMTPDERRARIKEINAKGEEQSKKLRLELPPLEHSEALSTAPASLVGAKPRGELTGTVEMEAYIQVGNAMFTVREDGTIWIDDFSIVYWNQRKGYGEAFMERIIQMARRQGISKIEGEIAKQDWDRREDLKAFYEKCGFEVHLDPSRQEEYFSLSM